MPTSILLTSMVNRVIIETHCLPPLHVIGIIMQNDEVIIEGHEHYQKRSYRNRIHLVDAQGPKSFSIPLKSGKNEQQTIQEVLLSYDTSWDVSLSRLIKTAYGSAPFFDFYYQELHDIIMEKHRYLWQLNHALLNYVCSIIGHSGPISNSSSYQKTYNESITDLRGKISPMDKWTSDLRYDQVFMDRHGFIEDLSILDMLMCCGPETPLYLQQAVFKNSSLY